MPLYIVICVFRRLLMINEMLLYFLSSLLRVPISIPEINYPVVLALDMFTTTVQVIQDFRRFYWNPLQIILYPCRSPGIYKDDCSIRTAADVYPFSMNGRHFSYSTHTQSCDFYHMTSFFIVDIVDALYFVPK